MLMAGEKEVDLAADDGFELRPEFHLIGRMLGAVIEQRMMEGEDLPRGLRERDRLLQPGLGRLVELVRVDHEDFEQRRGGRRIADRILGRRHFPMRCRTLTFISRPREASASGWSESTRTSPFMRAQEQARTLQR